MPQRPKCLACSGEWWNANVVDVENEALAYGGGANISDAFTINGSPGDLYPCSSERESPETIKLKKTSFELPVGRDLVKKKARVFSFLS